MKVIEKDINIKLSATQSVEVENETETDEYNAFLTGKITKKGSRIYLSFTENLNETEKVQTQLSFDESQPHIVALNRHSVLPTTFLFEKGARQMGHYELFDMTIEICIDTRELINTLTLDGGEIYMDYNVEFRGNVSQNNTMKIVCSI